MFDTKIGLSLEKLKVRGKSLIIPLSRSNNFVIDFLNINTLSFSMHFKIQSIHNNFFKHDIVSEEFSMSLKHSSILSDCIFFHHSDVLLFIYLFSWYWTCTFFPIATVNCDIVNIFAHDLCPCP